MAHTTTEQAAPPEEASRPEHEHDWLIARGQAEADPADSGREIRGAANDYNARGNGSTMVRRVYRAKEWVWVSKPASKGRYLASDRKDVERGPVYPGEIVAQYTLGGARSPERWWLTVADGEYPLIGLSGRHRRDGQYELSVDAAGYTGTVLVPDPYWR